MRRTEKRTRSKKLVRHEDGHYTGLIRRAFYVHSGGFWSRSVQRFSRFQRLFPALLSFCKQLDTFTWVLFGYPNKHYITDPKTWHHTGLICKGRFMFVQWDLPPKLVQGNRQAVHCTLEMSGACKDNSWGTTRLEYDTTNRIGAPAVEEG